MDPSKVRRINAIVALAIACLFTVHMLMGSAKCLVPAMPDSLAFVVWFGVVFFVAHVLLCVATSAFMLTDKKRPPSDKKKRHLLLKWISGGAMLLVAALHVARMAGVLPAADVAGAAANPLASVESLLTMAVLAGILAWHVFVGMKSLIRDLRIDPTRRLRTALRVLVIACAAIAIVALLAVIAR